MKKLAILFLTLLASCQPGDSPQNQVNFDRTDFLQSYADNFILPSYQNLVDELDKLNTVLDNQAAAQDQWTQTYQAFLKVSAFNFGPAEEQVLQKSLTEEIATFPVDASLINQKISTGDFNFEDFRRDSRGLIALEYLLFDTEAWSLDGREAYVKACLNDVISKVKEVNEKWAIYKSEFVLNDGTSTGSSTSALYNEFVKSFEGLRNFKVGLPLGLRPGQTAAVPENVEAFYSAQSLAFAQQHFQNLVQLWNGKNGVGFKDYLASVEGGELLINSTLNQIASVNAAFSNCQPSDFSTGQIDGNQKLIILHTELQKLTRFFKSDMSSLLGIAITYSSGDGD